MSTYNNFRDFTQAQNVQQQRLELMKALEPYLKQRLFEAMINRETITVKRPIQIIVERLGKGGTDMRGCGFSTGTAVIPAGEKIVFERRMMHTSQWLFKSLTKEDVDYEIYETPVVAVDSHNTTPNPGWFGLLQNTNIFDEVYAAWKQAHGE